MNTDDTRTTGTLTESERVQLQRAIAESDVAGCSLVDQDIDSLVDLFEAWLERRDREPSVEDCLRQLRKMFPHTWMFAADRVTWTQGSEGPTRSVVIEVGCSDNAFFSSTLRDCMAQVRSWKQEQEKT